MQYKDASVKVITTNPMSVESFKGSIRKAADDADTTLKKEGITEEKKTEEVEYREETSAVLKEQRELAVTLSRGRGPEFNVTITLII